MLGINNIKLLADRVNSVHDQNGHSTVEMFLRVYNRESERLSIFILLFELNLKLIFCFRSGPFKPTVNVVHVMHFTTHSHCQI